MVTRVPVAPEVVEWAIDRTHDPEAIVASIPKAREWIDGASQPTINQLTSFAAQTGTPFGYLLLPHPPKLELPIKDFRDGFEKIEGDEPSADLLAVINQSIRRQDWYRDYALDLDLPEVDVVGRARSWNPAETAADMRKALSYEVTQRRGSWNDQRKHLLRSFEDIGGLTVATSMVANNAHRMLDSNEFRGFSLVDSIAPLVFINTGQTLNGQIFTLAHELGHIWRGVGGVGAEDLRRLPQNRLERWCNDVASEFLVPKSDLREHFIGFETAGLVEQLESLARIFKCGTLVILQALDRHGLQQFDDFQATYASEVARLAEIAAREGPGGGQFYGNQPYRIGERLSHALIDDAIAGRTSIGEAIKLMSFKSLSRFDNYAAYLDKKG